jgi:hypothetical protein
MLTQIDVSNTAGLGGKVRVTRDGMYVFYGARKYLAKNLKSVLGTFSEGILAITSDGSIAVGATNIHDGNTFSISRPMPISVNVIAVSADDTTLYLYDTTSSRIYLYALK